MRLGLLGYSVKMGASMWLTLSRMRLSIGDNSLGRRRIPGCLGLGVWGLRLRPVFVLRDLGVWFTKCDKAFNNPTPITDYCFYYYYY